MSSSSGNSMKKSFQSISSKTGSSSLQQRQQQSIEFASTCSVCAEVDPKYWAVSSCGHKICWICSLRLRALYASKLCPICKSPSDFVFICKSVEASREFMTNGGKPIEALKKNNSNSTHSILYENEPVASVCEALLQLQCPFNSPNSLENTVPPQGMLTPSKKDSKAPCLKHFKSKFELRKHVQSAHELLVCEICLEHKKCFTIELALYNRTSLQKHQKEANHPHCKVCDRIFYSEDELNEHNRHEHELCHICQRTGHPNRYFLNYTRLEEHFGRDHFLCSEPLCKELKFVVFENELEYKAHQAEVHLSHQKMQRSQQRQLQRLNISFDGASTSSQQAVAPQAQAESLRLTTDQRNQIGLNLVYGEVTDELANRLQSLSLYQTRNDSFLESLRAVYHLEQNQVQGILSAARAYQRNESSATELVLKIEKILGSGLISECLTICSELGDLQLNEMLRQRLDVAVNEHRLKCSAFPALGGGTRKNQQSQQNHQPPQIPPTKTSAKLGFNSAVAGSNRNTFKGDDPFDFARKSTTNKINTSTTNTNTSHDNSIPKASSSFKVLQIVKPSTPNYIQPSGSKDPSKNPAMLLSHLAGGPRIKSAKKSTGTVKMTTFSSAAIGSLNTTAITNGNALSKTNFDESEFPSLGKIQSQPQQMQASSDQNEFLKTREIEAPNAFFAPSDRDQLESFTIGSSEDQDEKDPQPSNENPEKSGKKNKKQLVFKYGQKWNI